MPHLPENFEPALAQTPQGAGEGFCPVFEGLVVGVGPRAGVSALVSPQVKNRSEGYVALATKSDLVDGAGLITDRSSPAVALQGLRGFEPITILRLPALARKLVVARVC